MFSDNIGASAAIADANVHCDCKRTIHVRNPILLDWQSDDSAIGHGGVSWRGQHSGLKV